jgi:hypothetical protein
MIKLRPSFILHCLVFLIPVNIYAFGVPDKLRDPVGDWAVAGIQWALFQYQETVSGSSLISVSNLIRFIFEGDITGISAIPLMVGILAALLLVCSFIVNIASLAKGSHPYVRISSVMIIMCGLLFAISDLLLYGPLFHGPDGFCIPVGIPVMLFIGWWTYRHEDTVERLPKEKPAEKPEHSRERVINEISLLVFILIFVKIIVLSLSLYHIAVTDNVELSIYHSYASEALSGHIPYVDYHIEYPQLFLVPALIAALPTLLVPGHPVFVCSYIILMCLVDIAVLVCVYFIAARLFGNNKAFFCGLLYATAFFSAFAGSFSFDIVPTFFLVFSLLLFIYGREIPAYISAACGFLTKWFPAVCFPFFVVHTLKNHNDPAPMKKGLAVSCLLIFLAVIPFIILNIQGFLFTYQSQLGRPGSEVHSLIYYLDVVAKSVTGVQPFWELSVILLCIIEGFLLYWYYRHSSGKPVVLCYAIFFSVFAFILLNVALTPYFIIWIVPFLALFLMKSYWQVLLFYCIQLIMFLESPVLQGIVYASGKPYGIIEHGLPGIQFVFYSVKFLLFFILLWVIIVNMKRPEGSSRKKQRSRLLKGQ